MDSKVVIAADGLGKTFGEVVAVSDMSFTVRAGQVVAILGPNGAGKTTTIRMMTTLLPIDEGAASIGGHDVARKPDLVRQLIGVAGQSAAVDEKLTARENLELFGRLYKIPRVARRARVAALIERFDLGEFADRPVATYSGGERRRLDVVAALIAAPPALFLDEPTTGLDPRSRAELWDAIAALAAAGTAIVLTTQYLEEADRLADDILIIDHGKVVASGTPDTLKRDLERDVLEISVAAGSDVITAQGVLGPLDGLVADAAAGRLGIPVTDGAARSLEVLRSLQDAGVTITDFQLRRPTLDDVFLMLTGAATTQEVAS